MRRLGHWRCHYCNKKLTRKNWSTDHLCPLSRGGPDKPHNKVHACTSCNTLKGCLTVEEFRVVIAFRMGLLSKIRMKFPGEMKE